MAAYFLFDNVEVNDPVALARYAGQAGKLVAEHGGRSSPPPSHPRSWRAIPA